MSQHRALSEAFKVWTLISKWISSFSSKIFSVKIFIIETKSKKSFFYEISFSIEKTLVFSRFEIMNSWNLEPLLWGLNVCQSFLSVHFQPNFFQVQNIWTDEIFQRRKASKRPYALLLLKSRAIFSYKL